MLRALVLEHSKEKVREIRAVLASVNFHCELIADPSEGLEILRNHGELVHILIVNIDRNGPGGMELIQKQRKGEKQLSRTNGF